MKRLVITILVVLISGSAVWVAIEIVRSYTICATSHWFNIWSIYTLLGFITLLFSYLTCIRK